MFRPRFLPAAGLLVLAVLVLSLLGRRPDEVVNGAAHAIDGDSLVVGGREMRLKGLDAPEFRQFCEAGGQNYPCGKRAHVALVRALGRGPVTCLGHEADRYGRLLVVCRVNGRDIGADLVREGLAIAYGGYDAEEAEARREARGVWAGRFERPEAYRRRQREKAAGRS